MELINLNEEKCKEALPLIRDLVKPTFNIELMVVTDTFFEMSDEGIIQLTDLLLEVNHVLGTTTYGIADMARYLAKEYKADYDKILELSKDELVDILMWVD